METTLDKFGRIVIPKAVRDHYGLAAGVVLDIRSGEDGIVLLPQKPRPDLIEKGGVLVFTGEAEEDLEEAVERQREERMRQSSAWRR